MTTLTVQSNQSYKPQAPAGATDDYHCTLVNPHVTSNSFITSSQFYPNSVEVHHAILFLVPPNVVGAANAANHGGKGWTCFGETALPGTGLAQIAQTPWLTRVGAGPRRGHPPAGTGVKFPAGSMVIMQIHYNLLRGDKPVRSKLTLHTVPSSTPPKPLSLTLMPAPPDIPLPGRRDRAACATGPLRWPTWASASAAMPRASSTSSRPFAAAMHDRPAGGDTTSCSWRVRGGQDIVRLGVHMHLLGRGMKIVLNPGTPGAQTLLNVTNYDFNYQRSYTLKTPVHTHPGDKIGVIGPVPTTRRSVRSFPSCGSSRRVTSPGGDGSSDEMCPGAWSRRCGSHHDPRLSPTTPSPCSSSPSAAE